MEDKSAQHDVGRRVERHPQRSLAVYLLIALVAGIAIWTVQQNRLQDSEPKTGSGVRPGTTGPRGAKGSIRALFSTDDYPRAALSRREEGTVQAELEVDPRGRVAKCRIVRSGGRTLDDATCSIGKRRARFTPAIDVNGKAVADRVVTPTIVWRLEG